MHNTPRKLYINARWCESVRPQNITVVNPSNETAIGEVALGCADDVDHAVQAAAAAFALWNQTTGTVRAGYLRAIARGVAQQQDSLVRLQSLNCGKPLAESAMDVADVIATFNYYADLAEQLDAQPEHAVALPDDGFQACYTKQPCGVVALIVPWNFPMVTTAWKLAPALAAGCCVVLKPSEVTPLPELALASIIDAAGLPAGVLNVIPGTGVEVGAPLCAHPLISKISFTGSNAVGSLVMKAAADGIKGVSLELGGKSPIVVTQDADLELAVNLVVAGIFFNAGQMCSATSRLLVERSVAAPFMERLRRATAQIKVGDALHADTQMGPLVNALQYARVLHYIQRGLEDGLELVTGGTRMPGREQGYFVAPTIFNNVPCDHVLWREEIFGPVLCVHTFDSDAQAIAMANDCDFGLVATVVCGNAVRASGIARALQAGLVWINAPQLIFPQVAWGGFKKSSIGRELGPWGLAAFQEIKHIVQAA